jgi:hypothetical protein
VQATNAEAIGLDRRMGALEVTVARMETKLDELNRTLEPRGLDVETRLRVLERTRWYATGFAAAVGGFVGWVAPLLQH